MRNRTTEGDGDDPDTLPPLNGAGQVTPGWNGASALGDFRTYETSIATFRDEDLFEVRLLSTQGYVAHFGFDRRVATRVRAGLERELAHYGMRRSLGSAPRLPVAVPMDGRATDVFFAVEDSPAVRVEQEAGGDRIVLFVWSAEASLNITMHVGVALALCSFLSAAG